MQLPRPADVGTVYTGTLASRGTLAPGAKTEVKTGIWVGEPGLIALNGWEVERETGNETSEEWIPRSSWVGVGGAPSVEVIQG